MIYNLIYLHINMLKCLIYVQKPVKLTKPSKTRSVKFKTLLLLSFSIFFHEFWRQILNFPGEISEFGCIFFFRKFFIKKLNAKFSFTLILKFRGKILKNLSVRWSSVLSERVLHKNANRDSDTATFVHFKSFLNIN